MFQIGQQLLSGGCDAYAGISVISYYIAFFVIA